MDEFDTFWAVYPRRDKTPAIEGKKKAREKLEARIKSGLSWETVLAGVRAYAKCDRVKDNYIKMPVTWINNDCWEDEYEIPKTEKEIIAAKPLSERTPEEWRKILGEPTPFNKALIAKNMDRIAGAPQEVLKMYGLGERYG